ncbi:DUF3541 domain-containing protein [Shewanella denitrificans]|jgi:hypothetical protein|uniref:DUF3541 domain-containing protein n=1 Tax=Shewanella denitrificans TaxID=192073 RepID=UPI00005557CC|nr:DUF3541 domain-containing protein [Shewanella denitrificans]
MQVLRKSRTLSYLALSLALISGPLFAKGAPEPHNLSQAEVRVKIKDTFEHNLYSLPPRVQGHYGIRMYRMTGENKYANASLIDLITISDRLSFYACSSDDKEFIRSQSLNELNKLKDMPGQRAQARYKATTPYPDFMFYADILLRYASRVDEFGFEGPCHDKIIAALKAKDLAPALTDKKMIKAWAAQLINYAYWAEQLGVGNYVAQYKKAFIKAYPDNKDKKLSKNQYRNKIYGMTHFIFAASNYYQYPVDAKEFKWILDYFDKNIDRILKDATEDIVTEVGISFLLAGQPDHRVVGITQEFVTKAFSPKHQMIPSPAGQRILSSGEHRNVLAMMLLDWPEKMHPGPYFYNIPSTRADIPMMVKRKKDAP